MTKLEKSVRHEMKYYGADIRNRNLIPNGEVGCFDGEPPYIGKLIADYEDGLCTNITRYHQGDAYEVKHYYGDDCVDITDCVLDYWLNDLPWDELIYSIVCEIEEDMNGGEQ